MMTIIIAILCWQSSCPGWCCLFWQIFYMGPIQEKERLKREQAAEFAASKKGQGCADSKPAQRLAALRYWCCQGRGGRRSSRASNSGGWRRAGRSRRRCARSGWIVNTVLASSPRYPIDTPSISGSISLKGGRIDDIVLRKYRVKVDKDADEVVFFSPSGSEHPLYAEHGWSAAPGSKVKLPNAQTVWKATRGRHFEAWQSGHSEL